ncbi:MAG: hypothetical protein ABJ338_01885 [Lentilitoribacter sp.]
MKRPENNWDRVFSRLDSISSKAMIGYRSARDIARKLGAFGFIVLTVPALCLGCLYFIPQSFYLFVLISIACAFLVPVFWTLHKLRNYNASVQYRSGAANRLNAILILAGSQASFFHSNALLWAAVFFGGALWSWIFLGLTVFSFILTGALLGVGIANLAGAIYVRKSKLWVLVAKQTRVPVKSGWQTTRYATLAEVRLREDNRDDPERIASTIALISQPDAHAEGIPLRIKNFGIWPGQSFQREFLLRLRALPQLAALGAMSGLLILLIHLTLDLGPIALLDRGHKFEAGDTGPQDPQSGDGQQGEGQEPSQGPQSGDGQQGEGQEPSPDPQSGDAQQGEGQDQPPDPQSGDAQQGEGQEPSQDPQSGDGQQGEGQEPSPDPQSGDGQQGEGQDQPPDPQSGDGQQGEGQDQPPDPQSGDGQQGEGQEPSQGPQSGDGQQGEGQEPSQDPQSGDGQQGEGQEPSQDPQSGNGQQGEGQEPSQDPQSGDGQQGEGQEPSQDPQSGDGQQGEGQESSQDPQLSDGQQQGDAQKKITPDLDTSPSADTKLQLSLDENPTSENIGNNEGNGRNQFADRGARPANTLEISPSSVSKENNDELRPHIPEQDIPHWMKNIIYSK